MLVSNFTIKKVFIKNIGNFLQKSQFTSRGMNEFPNQLFTFFSPIGIK